jgi:hypothetical protein
LQMSSKAAPDADQIWPYSKAIGSYAPACATTYAARHVSSDGGHHSVSGGGWHHDVGNARRSRGISSHRSHKCESRSFGVTAQPNPFPASECHLLSDTYDVCLARSEKIIQRSKIPTCLFLSIASILICFGGRRL